VLSLTSLAGWEEAVMASVAGATGTMEERDRQIERSGLYGEYPAIVRAYLELLSDERSAGEALKRAVFLTWYSAVEPPIYTGLAALPDSTSRAVIEALDACIRRGEADDELAWMVRWYYEIGAYVFDLFGGSAQLLEFASRAPDARWREGISLEAMRGRGQMGRYWTAVAASPE
jgi:hypothetical protein